MPDPQPQTRKYIRIGARVLIGFGACVFVFGDRLIARFGHINFFLAMVQGFLAGLFLMVVGYIIVKMTK